MKKSLGVALVGLLSLSLTGCDNDYTRLKAEPHVEKTTAVAEKNMKSAKGLNDNEITNDPLQVSQNVWTGSTAVRLRRGQPLPKTLENDKGITLVAATPLSLGALGAQVAATSGIPVRLADDANGTTAGAVASASSSAGPSELNSPMTIAYEGPLSALLDQVGSHFNLSWRYDGSTITFFRYETRTFVMESMPGTQSITDGIQSSQDQGSSGGSSVGGGGSSNQNDVKQDSELKVDVAFWDDLKSTMDSILGGEGRFITAPSSGTVTVTTTPDRMRAVSTFVQRENERLARQVAINVDVYTVTLNNSDDYGLKLTGAFNNVLNSSTTGNTLGGVVSPVTDTSAGTIALAFGGHDLSGNGVLSALTSIGKTAVVTRMPVTTLNNRPASRKITVDQSYLASISTSAVSGAGTSTALTPGTVSTGITLQLLPRILNDGRIMLQYSLKMSELQSLKTFTASTDGSTSVTPDTIQLPEVANKIFVQQAMLANGSTLVLAGFDQDDQRGETRGIGAATNWLLGGGFTNSRDRTYLVIAITPRELSTGVTAGL